MAEISSLKIMYFKCIKSEELLTQCVYNARFNRQLIELVQFWLCALQKLPVCSGMAGLVIPFA